MYTKNKPQKTSLKINQSYQGETIEQKVARIMNNKEPISDSAPLVYTERKDGVLPDYNIRTDRWEHAIDAMDAVQKTKIAQREQRLGERSYDKMTPEEQKNFNKQFPKNKHNKPGGTASTSDNK